jgi:hypothetical protein
VLVVTLLKKEVNIVICQWQLTKAECLKEAEEEECNFSFLITNTIEAFAGLFCLQIDKKLV